jgi:hypothetical protein
MLAFFFITSGGIAGRLFQLAEPFEVVAVK